MIRWHNSLIKNKPQSSDYAQETADVSIPVSPGLVTHRWMHMRDKHPDSTSCSPVSSVSELKLSRGHKIYAGRQTLLHKAWPPKWCTIYPDSNYKCLSLEPRNAEELHNTGSAFILLTDCSPPLSPDSPTLMNHDPSSSFELCIRDMHHSRDVAVSPGEIFSFYQISSEKHII